MDKVIFLKWSVIALIALNLLTLSILVGPHLLRAKKQGVEKHFDFTVEQMRSFENSRNQIRAKLDSLNPRLQALSKDYYLNKGDAVTSSVLLAEINKTNEAIYKAHFQHFRDIEGISDAEQEKYLEEFIAILIKPGGRRPPKR